MADILEMLRIKNINVIHTSNIFPIIRIFRIKHDSDDSVQP